MINYKPVSLEDKEWVKELLFKSEVRGCEHTFGNIFIWTKQYNNFVAEVDGYLVVKSCTTHSCKYYFPVGSGDIKNVINVMLEDAKESGRPFDIFGATPQDMELLEANFPGKFHLEPKRDYFDYVYSIEKLTTLAGKKLHGKRNHINKFLENNPGWHFEVITKENIKECEEMNEEWSKINCVNESQRQESCAVKRALKNFEELDLDGGLLRLDGRVIAFTIGEPVSSDTYVTHIEKAFSDIQGAYPMINREFARYINAKYPNIKYINREEDVGSEGLRKAKLSYYPEFMVEKGDITLK